VVVLGVGLGAAFRRLPARTVSGVSRLAPSTAPATPAVLPMNARRESACRTWRFAAAGGDNARARSASAKARGILIPHLLPATPATTRTAGNSPITPSP